MAAKLITRINTFLRTEKNKRDALQALLVECIQDAQQAGDSFDNLSTLIRGLIELKSRNSNAIREYVGNHVTNISWSKNKSGVYMFVKAVKGEPCEYKEITYPWFNEAGNMASNTNTEVGMDSVKRMLNNLKKRIEKNGVSADDAERVHAFLAQAESMAAE